MPPSLLCIPSREWLDFQVVSHPSFNCECFNNNSCRRMDKHIFFSLPSLTNAYTSSTIYYSFEKNNLRKKSTIPVKKTLQYTEQANSCTFLPVCFLPRGSRKLDRAREKKKRDWLRKRKWQIKQTQAWLRRILRLPSFSSILKSVHKRKKLEGNNEARRGRKKQCKYNIIKEYSTRLPERTWNPFQRQLQMPAQKDGRRTGQAAGREVKNKSYTPEIL